MPLHFVKCNCETTPWCAKETEAGLRGKPCSLEMLVWGLDVEVLQISHAFLGDFILSFSVLHLWLCGKIIGFIKKSFISTQYFRSYSVCEVMSSVMASSEAPHTNLTMQPGKENKFIRSMH